MPQNMHTFSHSIIALALEDSTNLWKGDVVRLSSYQAESSGLGDSPNGKGTLLGYQVIKRNPPASAILRPRETESLTEGIEIPSFFDSDDMGTPSSLTAQ